MIVEKKTLKYQGMEFIMQNINKGFVFEIYKLKNGRLECYVYPQNKETDKKFFASTSKTMNCMDFLVMCQHKYNYKKN